MFNKSKIRHLTVYVKQKSANWIIFSKWKIQFMQWLGHKFAVWFLFAFLLGPTLVREVHHLHFHNTPKALCDSEHGDQHLHDSSFNHEHCYLCSFSISNFKLAEPLKVTPRLQQKELVGSDQYQHHYQSFLLLLIIPRAPPSSNRIVVQF